MGSHAYDLLLGVNTRLTAMRYISNFEAAVAFEAVRLGVEGSSAAIFDGDWVESNSALVEHGGCQQRAFSR